MRYLANLFIMISLLCGHAAHSDKIIGIDKDISQPLREVFTKAGINVPPREDLLSLLKANFDGAPTFNQMQMATVLKTFAIDMQSTNKLSADILGKLYEIFDINKDGYLIAPEIDTIVLGTNGPDVNLQKLVRLKLLEEKKELKIKNIVIITNDSYKMLDRFRSIDDLERMMMAYNLSYDRDVLIGFLKQYEEQEVTHAQAFENIVIKGTELKNFFENRWSIFETGQKETQSKYQDYFEETASYKSSQSVAALESSFLQNNKERNKLIFDALTKAKECTGTNNLQFVGTIVVAPLTNEDGFMDVKKEMAAHISSPGQTVVDLFVATLRALWFKNQN